MLGILNLVFGGLGLVSSPLLLLGRKLPGFPQVSERLHGWLAISIPVGMVTAVALLALGIGLLKMKEWARVGSIVYGYYAIVWGVLGMAMTIKAVEPGAPAASGPERIQALAGLVGGVIGGLTSLTYAVILIVLLGRPKLRDAFR